MSEFNLEEGVSLEAIWKLWSQRTRDQKNPSKMHLPRNNVVILPWPEDLGQSEDLREDPGPRD